MMQPDIVERFIAKLQIQRDGCWLWTAAQSGSGYGKLRVDDRPVDSHRLSWEMFRGPIPDGYEIDHVVCGVKLCVNPNHLEPVPVEGRENTKRYQASRTHCRNGHPKTPENRRTRPDGTSECRACDVLRQRRRRRLAGKPRLARRERPILAEVSR